MLEDVRLRYPDGMRVVYSTPRLENAERVAQLLENEGIQVRLLFGPHYKRNSWRGANYRQQQNPGDWPRVLVLNNGDMPQARAALRAVGLMAPPAFKQDAGNDATNEPLVFSSTKEHAPDPGAGARRLRLALIAAVFLIAVIQAARFLF